MNAQALDHPGPPTDWRTAEVEKPEPQSGEARARVIGVGLSPADQAIYQGVVFYERYKTG